MMNDHARGCQGREYTCNCGYDEQQEAEIKRFKKDRDYAIRWANKAVEDSKSDYENLIRELLAAVAKARETIGVHEYPVTGSVLVKALAKAKAAGYEP